MGDPEINVKGEGSFRRVDWGDGGISVASAFDRSVEGCPGDVVEVEPTIVILHGTDGITRDVIDSDDPHFKRVVRELKKHEHVLTLVVPEGRE